MCCTPKVLCQTFGVHFKLQLTQNMHISLLTFISRPALRLEGAGAGMLLKHEYARARGDLKELPATTSV